MPLRLPADAQSAALHGRCILAVLHVNVCHRLTLI
jgi:hypothetical protein